MADEPGTVRASQGAQPWDVQREASPGPSAFGFFICTWAVLVLLGRSRFFLDPGTFWHVLTGDRILESGLPRTDVLSFTFGGHAWTAHEWLAECGMAVLHHLGGLDALLIATAAALALLFSWIFHRLVAVHTAPRWAAPIAAVALLSSGLHFHARPHILSILLFAWTYARLIDFESGRISEAALLWLWPVFVVWANCHGAVVGAIGTVLLAVLGWIGLWIVRRPSPVHDFAGATRMALLAVGLGTTPLVNPYGVELIRTWAVIVRSPELPHVLVEHFSVVKTGMWWCLATAVLFIAVLLSTPVRRWRTTSLLPLVWIALACARVRNAPLYAAVATLALAELLRTCGVTRLLHRHGIELLSRPRVGLSVRYPWARCALAIVLAFALVGAIHGAKPGRETFIARLNVGWWPVTLVPQLRATARGCPPGTPVMNDLVFGGFLPYEVPALRVFVDDRWELYGDAFMMEYVRRDPVWLDGWVTRSRVALAVTRPGSKLDDYFRAKPGWHKAASSDPANIFLRDGAESACPEFADADTGRAR